MTHVSYHFHTSDTTTYRATVRYALNYPTGTRLESVGLFLRYHLNVSLDTLTIPFSNLRYRHFTGPLCDTPLIIKLGKDWSHVHKFRSDSPQPATASVLYVAVPFFDVTGRVRGYLAADTLRMHEQSVCCSVLQCDAVCCSVLLQCVVVCCRVLQSVAVCCSTSPPIPFA